MDRVLWLSGRGLIAVSGPDAPSFLQGLVTVDALKLEHPRYAALLTPQGKFLHDFFLLADGERILIDTEKSRAAELMDRLKRYKLRAQVTVEPVENVAVFAGGDKGFVDPRFAPLGFRLYGPAQPGMQPGDASSFAKASEDYKEYDLRRLQLGIPASADFIPDRSLIVECGFEALHGVDFNKGCYVGQEVTARTKFRSHLRKQFYRVEGDSPLPAFGTKIMAGEKEAGELRTSQGTIGMAMLYNEMAGAEKLTCGNVIVRAALPAWAAPETAGEKDATSV